MWGDGKWSDIMGREMIKGEVGEVIGKLYGNYERGSKESNRNRGGWLGNDMEIMTGVVAGVRGIGEGIREKIMGGEVGQVMRK